MNQAKKRIVVGITLAEPGGATSFVFGFSKWLQQQGHEVIVLAGDGGWLFDRCREAGISAYRIRGLGRAIRPVRDWFAYREIKQRLLDLKPDVVHVNSAKMGVLGSLAARRAKVPRVVYRIGGWSFLEPILWPLPWFYRTVEWLTAGLKDVIVCVHSEDERIARTYGIRPREKMVTIPNGIDLFQFDRSLQPRDYGRTLLQLDPRAFVFGTVAHFYPAKDIPRYLEACAMVAHQRPRALFVIIGNGPERRWIRLKRFNLGLEREVILAGNHENAASLMRAFDAFVLPSQKEGMSRALLEAMSAGLPCIATDVGASRWMLGDDAGWIVPRRSPKEMAAAMLFVMDHAEEAKQRGANARRAVDNRFPLNANYIQNETVLFGDGLTSAAPTPSSPAP